MGAFDDLVPGGNITISEGRQGVGAQEAKTREAQFTSTPQLRQIARDLATANVFNQRIPTGRFAANVSGVQQQFPSNWQPKNIADYQSFMGLRQALTKPVISLTAPSGTNISSKEMDTPRELEMALMSVPGPDKERGANNYLINRAGKATLDKIAFNAFMDRWRANNGSAYGKAKNGQTATQAWASYQNSPQYKRTVLTPYTKLLSGAPRKAARSGKVIDFNDLPE